MHIQLFVDYDVDTTIYIYTYIYIHVYIYIFVCVCVCIYMNIYISGLALDIILCSPFWLLCDNFKSPKIKPISQIYNTKTSQIDLSHILLKI